ncbi:MAG: S8 family peptidase [Firmicutes bacterium]|nr:S8 family peptidase [Bacillota bacterium]
MAERPIILFAEPQSAAKEKRGGGSGNIAFPPHKKQVSRLEPKLKALQKVLDDSAMLFQQAPEGIEPERTLVFEVAGDVGSFYTAINHFRDNAEWILDTSEDRPVSDDFYVMKKDGQLPNEKKDTFTAKIYCAMTNNTALREMLSLWKQYADNESMSFPAGQTGLRDVFKKLIDVHVWGYKERLEETGILEAWKADLELEPNFSEVKCEIELFYRKSKELQRVYANNIIRLLKNEGGNVLAQTVIDEINYHAILASLPRQKVQSIIDGRDEVSLVSTEQIMFFRPTGQSVTIPTMNISKSSRKISMPSAIENEPIIALFDGLPQENHPYLDGILNIDDPDNYTEQYTIAMRKHGTSMASFIAHGDLNNIKHQVTHKIYVRPIMRPRKLPDNSVEEIPNDRLIVDTIHRAVRRLFEYDEGPVAPTVRIINLSIGILYRRFDQIVSPLARLLDWLSYKYRVLFIVSAGNYQDGIDTGITFNDFSALDIEKRTEIIIKALDRNKRIQKLLSPAESINSLTIGASFSDESTFEPDQMHLLPCSDNMVSPISTFGKGINDSIKPDIIFDGGRSTLQQNFKNPTQLLWRDSQTRPPGSLSAAPLDLANNELREMRSFGTSNAAAMISHEASRCFDVITEIFDNINETLPYDIIALLIKAMLVHGSEWGELSELFNSALGKPKQFKDSFYRFFGYGKPNIDKVVECTKNRITLLGYGELNNNDAHIFNLPLPFNEFTHTRLLRRLTATLAYFCPINPSRGFYRDAKLWFAMKQNEKDFIGDRINASWQAVQRGSLQHEIFESDKIIPWDEEGSIKLKVNCSNASISPSQATLPYALMVSFEIKADVDIDVYERVVAKIRPQIKI